MSDSQARWVPTVNDLRVKLCYICREEEQYDHPEDPPRAWTHPCSCTLIAHESCLLKWIKSAQQDPARAPNALKCPQCKATYDLESDNPRILRILNVCNAALSAVGKVVSVAGAAGVAMSFGFTIYVVSTTYGALAVKEFLGEEMYNLLLTDDPAKWPWHAFLHLPIIPVSLVLSRTRLFDSFPLVPLFFTWTSSPPVYPGPGSGFIRSLSQGHSIPFAPPLNWPPTPLMAMVLLPFVRIAYRHLFDRLTRSVMGSNDSSDGGIPGRIRRVVWALNQNGRAHLRVRIGANVQEHPREGANENPQQQNANGIAAADGEDPPDDPAAVAERTLHVTTSSLGRFVGGALLIPYISSRMGSLLFRLSRHSSLLRTFLAIRDWPQVRVPPTQIKLFDNPPGSQAGLLKQLGSGFAAGINIMCGGTPTWNAHDPVWWRNAVGLGLFVFTKDCVRLLHLWLTKRELESRKVKDRSFVGVDVKDLDLIPSRIVSTSEGEANHM